MNLPNKLTLLRILFVPLMIAAILIDFPLHYLTAGIIFGMAAVTDSLDGRIARKYKLEIISAQFLFQPVEYGTDSAFCTTVHKEGQKEFFLLQEERQEYLF